ncbi:protein grindelwald [Eupeodes corollae]|uniref:protein grindelwald n=1 Tax=Eupeodes corollae TaxID=290404 RepID=UPI00248FBBCA|nr:protein grindelwald [Eupeodes corollae]
MNGALSVAVILMPAIHGSLSLELAQVCKNEKVCSSEEYCSPFSERCENCEGICDTTSHNYHESDCNKYCAGYNKDDNLPAQVRAMKEQQDVIFIILIILLIIVIFSNGIKIIRWLRRRQSIRKFLKKITSKKEKNSKEQNAGTIANVMNMHEPERPPSQIFSVTGMEGSTVLTVTTPVSTRYPAEDSTTTTEYSYDNAGLQVTPSSNKTHPFPQNSY